ncbi:acetyltransferase [Solihabitans fulvus]|uniref:Lysine N-acyltransferase MbtK n=1 Tax=Solihabitans fulvus TaxID=1892852 RepID=A0A5B2XGS3_9PSEU|nr:GNAT family N-acetyltransferase [Solihabitans fulvus]KAA2261992.1 acetyltransferase [Solihabitans fulvus]
MSEQLVGVSAPPVPVLGDGWALRVVDPDSPDLDLVQRWMQAPHVAAYWLQAWPRQRWHEELSRQLGGTHSRPCLVSRDGIPVLYLEIYRPVLDQLGACYPARPQDVGLHLAIGELGRTGRGLVSSLLPVLTAALFEADPLCGRVLLEPDVRNTAAVRAFGSGGFRLAGEIDLPDKTAALFVCPRTEEDML